MKTVPYRPPEGTYDLPFSWIYDASQLTDLADFPKQFVYLQGGYGDFVLRRLVGLDRVLEDYQTGGGVQSDGGTYRIYDRYGDPLQSDPMYANGSPGLGFAGLANDIGYPHEVIYPETGQIKFDLFRVFKPALQPSSAQIAFQGVRRMKGSRQARPGYKAIAKTFSYQRTVPITGVAGTFDPYIMRQQVKDYDFELYDIRMLLANGGSISAGPFEGGIGAVLIVGEGAAYNVQIINTGAPLTPFSINVVGNTITVQTATDAAGTQTTTVSQLKAAWDATPAAVALAAITVLQIGFLPVLPLTALAATVYAPLRTPAAALWIRDSNRVAIASAPMLDIYCDGSPWGAQIDQLGSIYGNGALVPPLYYPKDTQIQIDFHSVIDDATTIPQTLIIYLVGKQYFPC